MVRWSGEGQVTVKSGSKSQKLSLTKLVIILQESPRSVTVQDQTYDTVEYWHKIYEDSMTQFFDIFSDNGKQSFNWN